MTRIRVPTEPALDFSIVSGIIEAHAGRVWLDDPEPGGGAVFAFTLPAVPAEPADAPQAATVA